MSRFLFCRKMGLTPHARSRFHAHVVYQAGTSFGVANGLRSVTCAPYYENLSWKQCASANFEQRITWSRLVEGMHRRAVEERPADVEDGRQAPFRIGAMTQETAR